ncbi:MSHA biogenesis protein MshK [Massilia sp. PAMC28688]|nr:MSHA biogenesis protein MshK [Massilia sp. PAMC28688]
MKHACLLAAAAWQLATLAPAHAQSAPVSDPTRPPAALIAPVRTPDGAISVPVERAEPRLQSVLVSLSPGGRRVAVIDGKMVRQGQRFGDAVVVSIGAREVVLRRGARTQILKLYRPAPKVAQVQP